MGRQVQRAKTQVPGHRREETPPSCIWGMGGGNVLLNASDSWGEGKGPLGVGARGKRRHIKYVDRGWETLDVSGSHDG